MLAGSIPVLFVKKFHPMAKEPEYYRRRLPHWQPADGVFHLALRLYGSLPRNTLEQMKQSHENRIRELEQMDGEASTLTDLIDQERTDYFLQFDQLLDQCKTGPYWLKDEEIATIVISCFLHWHEQERFKLVALCVMPNHVHVILYKIQLPLFRILQTIKTYTAKQANALLKRHGEHFWQRETYDHLIRTRKEFDNQVSYVLNNPVAARLADHWEDWPFTVTPSGRRQH